MNDFDEIIASLKKGIGEMAEDAQKKYNELVEYLDSHSSDEIKADLRKHAENIGAEAKEGFARLLEGPSGLLRVELLPYHLTAGAKYPFVGRTYDPGFDESRPVDADLAPFRAHGLPAVVL